MAKRWRFIVQRGRSAQFSLQGSQRNRLRARTFSVPNEPLYPTGTYHWKSYSAHLLYSPAPLFPRSLVWSELSEGDLTALSPRVFEWSSVQRGDLYSQKSGLKQRWPRAPAFTAYTGSMLRDAFAKGPLSFSLSCTLFFSRLHSLCYWPEQQLMGEGYSAKSRETKKTSLSAFISRVT